VGIFYWPVVVIACVVAFVITFFLVSLVVLFVVEAPLSELIGYKRAETFSPPVGGILALVLFWWKIRPAVMRRLRRRR
jgi:hypothetical protein